MSNFKHGFDSKNTDLNPDNQMISNIEMKQMFIGHEGNIKEFLDAKKCPDPILIHKLIKFGYANNMMFKGYEEKAYRYIHSYEYTGLEKLIKDLK